MTAQVPERLKYEGEIYGLLSEPLAEYLRTLGERVFSKATSTANWRGYVGTWEISEGRLYLTDLAGTLVNGEAASLHSLFPSEQGRMLADWYSGTLRVPQGDLLQYVHAGFASTYERDLMIMVRDGLVVSISVKTNDAPGLSGAQKRLGKSGYVSELRSRLQRLLSAVRGGD